MSFEDRDLGVLVGDPYSLLGFLMTDVVKALREQLEDMGPSGIRLDEDFFETLPGYGAINFLWGSGRYTLTITHGDVWLCSDSGNVPPKDLCVTVRSWVREATRYVGRQTATDPTPGKWHGFPG